MKHTRIVTLADLPGVEGIPDTAFVKSIRIVDRLDKSPPLELLYQAVPVVAVPMMDAARLICRAPEPARPTLVSLWRQTHILTVPGSQAYALLTGRGAFAVDGERQDVLVEFAWEAE